MHNYPESWEESTLGNISLINMGQSPSGKSTSSDKSGVPLIGGASDLGETTPLAERYTSQPTKLCDKNDLVLCIRATIGKINVADKVYCLGRGVAGFKPFVNQLWVKYWLANEASRLKSMGTGTTFKQIGKETLTSYSIPIPPLNEQKRIVKKIDALQARTKKAREALEAVPPLLEKFRQSVLSAAFRGDLTKEWREKNPGVEPASILLEHIRIERRRRWEENELAKMLAKGRPPKNDAWKKKYKEPEPVDTTGLPELPEGWCWASIDELSLKVTDGVHKKPIYVEEGIPFVTVKNLTAGPGISFDNINYITQDDHDEFIKRTHPEKGDILVSKDGTLGVVRIIDIDVVFSIFVSVALVKPVHESINNHIARMLESPQGQKRMKATGTGLQHIHLVDLRKTTIPLAPISEQLEITKKINTLLCSHQHLLNNTSELLSRLDVLENSILSKGFRGELVPQDPNDEPASVLLERIRAEREKQGTATKKRR